ncbi:hypothetical protein RQP46_010464 [Phenoliferia psychrophenolica]
MAAYLANKESNATIGIGFVLGRVYTVTMLVNLNMRKSLVQDSSGASSSGNGIRRFGFGPKKTKSRMAFTTDGITVNHERTVHVEEPIRLDDFGGSDVSV